MLLRSPNAVLVVKKTPQNFYQCSRNSKQGFSSIYLAGSVPLYGLYYCLPSQIVKPSYGPVSSVDLGDVMCEKNASRNPCVGLGVISNCATRLKRLSLSKAEECLMTACQLPDD